MTITVIDPANLKSFTDINGHWAENDINSAVGIGLFKGTSDTTFSPEKTLTRGELVTILYRMAGEPKAPASSSFTDVPAGKFYSEAVAWAAENGIVKGLAKDTFAPNLEVTREQIATILYRYAEFREIDVSEKADLSGFQDAGKVSNFAKDAMAWAVAVGLIRGIEADTLAPNGVATRAQAATLAIRFLDL